MVDSTPQIPESQISDSVSRTRAVKIATPDIILFNEDPLPVDALSQLLFEDLAAQELVSISRSDLIEGKEISYNLISNLKALQESYNSENIFSLPENSKKYFRNFGIRFDIHVPETGTGPNGERSYVSDANTPVANKGDLVIDVTNMEINERVDIEILRRGRALGDTIYVEES